MTQTPDGRDFESDAVRRLRDDLALALRAAAHHGLAEGVCNHFSMAQVLAQSTGRPVIPVDAEIAQRVCVRTLGERAQSELFFAALRRTLP